MGSARTPFCGLVGNAWAGFGAAFGPLIILSLYWKYMNRWGALAGMVVGAVTVFVLDLRTNQRCAAQRAFIRNGTRRNSVNTGDSDCQ